MFEIPETTFHCLTGCELKHFVDHFLVGDDWSVVLKATTILEAVSKRSLGIKLGIDPDARSVTHTEFFSALCLCRDSGVIPSDAFDFANKLRLYRNSLAHSGAVLGLRISDITESKEGGGYIKALASFVTIEGQNAQGSEKFHRNALLMGVVGFVSYAATSLFAEQWFKQ